MLMKPCVVFVMTPRPAWVFIVIFNVLRYLSHRTALGSVSRMLSFPLAYFPCFITRVVHK
jgi:hypothetical protein